MPEAPVTGIILAGGKSPPLGPRQDDTAVAAAGAGRP